MKPNDKSLTEAKRLTSLLFELVELLVSSTSTVPTTTISEILCANSSSNRPNFDKSHCLSFSNTYSNIWSCITEYVSINSLVALSVKGKPESEYIPPLGFREARYEHFSYTIDFDSDFLVIRNLFKYFFPDAKLELIKYLS